MREIRVPILAYHTIGRTSSEKREIGEEIYRVSLRSFEEQMSYLKARGYRAISLDDFVAWKKGEGKIPERAVILTFDDGNISAFASALPILRRYDFCATFFICAGAIGLPHMMGWEELAKLNRNGMCIGSHGLNHSILTQLSPEEVRLELITSKKILEEKLKEPVKFLSIPRGFYNSTIREIAKSAGYVAVCSSRVGQNSVQADLFSLKRLTIKANCHLDEFAALIEGDRKAILKRKSEESAKRAFQKIVGIRNYDRLRSWLLQSKN